MITLTDEIIAAKNEALQLKKNVEKQTAQDFFVPSKREAKRRINEGQKCMSFSSGRMVKNQIVLLGRSRRKERLENHTESYAIFDFNAH
jgi:hypothetical protein